MAALKKGKPEPRTLFDGYENLEGTYDEFFRANGRAHPAVSEVVQRLSALSPSEFRRLQRLADAIFLRSGITFTLYSGSEGTERIFPFDLIPRVIAATEWEEVERGLAQRVTAINHFLADVYGDQRILEEGIVPRHLVEGSKGFRPELKGLRPPSDVWVHIAGVDLIRDGKGRFTVLEDNVRVPSGVSYVLENRETMKKTFPQVFRDMNVVPVESYTHKLREAMAWVAPGDGDTRNMAVLTPGPFNSAYFEHSYLARRIGCELVQGSDLFVEGRRVYAKTTAGPSPIDVLYRRIDDDFLDPKVFREDSMIGVPGLIDAWAAGNVAIVNAVGTGVADDKGIYPFVPDMIRFYLSEDAILPQVPTYVCAREKDCAYVLDHLDELVVKAVNEAGGYGMLMGPTASKSERKEFGKRIAADPRNYIAQPRIELSSAPTWTPKGVGPRRVDLRPFVVTGESPWVLSGGLTRVALRKGSYVVNSSQGGGLEGHLGRGDESMIARVADSCFWLTRYLERVDTWSRMLEVATVFSLDVKTLESGRWAPLITVVGQEEHFVETVGAGSLEDAEAVQEYLVWSDAHPSSLYSSLRFARENARTIREVISVETWESVNELWIWFRSRQAKRLFRTERDAFYRKLCSHCMQIHGICYSTMLHDDPFTFMKLGRALERVGQTGRILDVSHVALESASSKEKTPAEAAQWLAILRSLSAYEPFFKRRNNVLSGRAVAEFLIFERTFPRSVLHNLDRVRGLLVRLGDSEEVSPALGRSWTSSSASAARSSRWTSRTCSRWGCTR